MNNSDLLRLTELIPVDLGFLVFIRISSIVFILPILGSLRISVSIRLAISFSISALIMPTLLSPSLPIARSTDFLLACGAELINGLFIGFLIRTVFWAVQIFGSMAAQAISLSQILGNQVETPQPAMGQFVYVAAIALATILDFHVIVLASLIHSFELYPPGQPVATTIIAQSSMTAVQEAFTLGFTLAGPFLITAVLYNICLGVVNKAMPQLMVAFIGAPAITWAGIIILMISSPIILRVWIAALMNFSLADRIN